MKSTKIIVVMALLAATIGANGLWAQASNASLNGRYAFFLREVGDPPYVGGSFQADGAGNISSCAIDSARGKGTGTIVSNAGCTAGSGGTTGSIYAITADGRGTLTIVSTDAIIGTFRARIALVSGSFAYITKFDTVAPAGTGGGDVGFLQKQTTADFNNTALSGGGGGFAVQMRGENSGVVTGRFTLASTGAITAGSIDVADGSGTAIPTINFTGTVATAISSTTGRGTVTFTFSSPPPGFPTSFALAIHIISANKIVIIGQSTSTSDPALGGVAEKQSGTFSNASLNGTFVFIAQGGSNFSEALIGKFAVNGAGAFSSGVFDQNDGTGAVINGGTFSGTYSVASNGRGTAVINVTGDPNPGAGVLYLISSSRAFFMDPSNSDGFAGEWAMQTGGPFSNSSLNGNYTFMFQGTDTNSLTGSNDYTQLGVFTAGSINLVQDVSDGGTLTAGQMLTGTFAVDAAGHGAFTFGTNADLHFYMVSPTRVAFLNQNTNLLSFGFADASTGNSAITNAPAVTLSRNSIDFGNQAVSTTSGQQVVTLTNTGVAALTITSIAKSGTNAADYTVSNNCPLSPNTVAVNGTCTITITFTPSSTGTRTATVSITDNAAGSPHTISLTGNGIQSGPDIGLNPTSLVFTAQVISTTSAAKTSTITNTGNQPLTISTMVTGGTNAGDFNVSNNCPISPNTLAAAGTCTITVTFTPTGAGNRVATVTITSNAPSSPTTLNLSGTGVTPPAVSLTPAAPLDFGNQSQGITSSARAVTLTNPGGATLTITSILISAGAPDFVKSSDNCGASVAPAATCTINITFTPSALGTRNGTLTVTTNASTSPDNYAMTGNGVAAAPGVSLNPASLAFGNVLVNLSVGLPVTLTNTGNAALTIQSITMGGTNPGEFSQTTTCPLSPATLSQTAPNNTCTITVRFLPTTTSARSATLTITSNASGSPHTVALSGSGIDFSFTPGAGSSTSQTVTAGGTATFNLNFTTSGGFAGQVTFTCTNLPPQAQCGVNPPSGTPPLPVVVTVNTGGSGGMMPPMRGPIRMPPLPAARLWLAWMTWLLAAGLLLALHKTRRWHRKLRVTAAALALIILVGSWAGCTMGAKQTTPPGTYPITLTATSGSLSQSITLNLTVN